MDNSIIKNTVFGKIKLTSIPKAICADNMYEITMPEKDWTGIDDAHYIATLLDDEGNDTSYVMRGEHARDALKIIIENLAEGEFHRLLREW